MTTPSIPHPIETYHGKTTLIEHEKQVRNQNDSITQQFKFRIEINDGRMCLLVQKDGQRRTKATKESQIQSLTVDVIKKILVWMDFPDIKFKTMNKPALVEFICLMFKIPTTATLNITESDTTMIIQHLIDIIEEESIVIELTDYIEYNQTNMRILADIIKLCREERIDLRRYISPLWIELINNFQVNRNDDCKYRKGFDSLTESDQITNLHAMLENEIGTVLNSYNNANNNSINHCLFWYSMDVLLFRFFNYSVKQCILLTYVEVATDNDEQKNEPICEQRKCAIYKFFGSTLNALEHSYKGKNYGELKSKALNSIVSKCLVAYTVQDFEDDQQISEECKNVEYLKVPLRLRLQNRGCLRLINESFFNNIAIKIYSTITNDIERVFVCYDAKKIQQMEQRIINDKLLYNNFTKHIGAVSNTNENQEQQYTEKVWKELVHRVTSRIVLSSYRRYKVHNNHIDLFRMGVKAKQSKQ